MSTQQNSINRTLDWQLGRELEKKDQQISDLTTALRECVTALEPTKPRADVGSEDWHRIEEARRQALTHASKLLERKTK